MTHDNGRPQAEHSVVAAESARAIAARHPALDPDNAYVLGLLHDVGRGAGGQRVADVRLVLDGYRFMLEQGCGTPPVTF
jgi:HD superfamily phosphodiesterase